MVKIGNNCLLPKTIKKVIKNNKLGIPLVIIGNKLILPIFTKIIEIGKLVKTQNKNRIITNCRFAPIGNMGILPTSLVKYHGEILGCVGELG